METWLWWQTRLLCIEDFLAPVAAALWAVCRQTIRLLVKNRDYAHNPLGRAADRSW